MIASKPVRGMTVDISRGSSIRVKFIAETKPPTFYARLT